MNRKNLLATGFLVVTVLVLSYFVSSPGSWSRLSGKAAPSFPEDMRRYWNLKPGNYWILSGYNRMQGRPVTSKLEVEREVNLVGSCWYGGASHLKVTPLRYTKDSGSAYWGMNNWGSLQDTYDKLFTGDKYNNLGYINMRFMLVSQNTPGLNYIYSLGEKKYYRSAIEPQARLGLWSGTSYYGTPTNGFPPYAYSKLSYSSYADANTQFSYKMQYFVKDLTPSQLQVNAGVVNAWDGRNILDGQALDICKVPKDNTNMYINFGTNDNMSGRFLTGNVNVPGTGYVPAFISVQAEIDAGYNGRCDACSYQTREDWYLAKDVGFYKIEQKDFSRRIPTVLSRTYAGDNKGSRICPDGDGSTNSICSCDNLMTSSGPDVDCKSTSGLRNILRTDQSIIDETLVKYYLIDWPLVAKVSPNRWQEAADSASVKQGASFDLKITDSKKGFTYEGYVRPSSPFFGKSKIFMKDGHATVYVARNTPTGKYTVSFLPEVSSVLGIDSSETAGASPVLPAASNTVTITVTAWDSGVKPIAFDNYSYTVGPQYSNDGLYPAPGKDEAFTARNLIKTTTGALEERVYQGLRYFMRSSPDKGKTWGRWYTQTSYHDSAGWNGTTSNNPSYPHPDLSRPMDGYTLDYNITLKRYEERVYQDTRYWMRSSPGDMAHWNNWWTDTFASSWSSGTIHPNTGQRIFGTSFTYTGSACADGSLVMLEEVWQTDPIDKKDKIYQRTMCDNYKNISTWTNDAKVPYDQTRDLGI